MSLDKYPFFLSIIMKIIMFASVFIKYTWYLIYWSLCKYLQMVCPTTFLSLYRIRSLSLSLCSNYFKNICGLCNGKYWPPFALLAKLLTLPTHLYSLLGRQQMSDIETSWERHPTSSVAWVLETSMLTSQKHSFFFIALQQSSREFE